jgi:hypothetical protein
MAGRRPGAGRRFVKAWSPRINCPAQATNALGMRATMDMTYLLVSGNATNPCTPLPLFW